MWKRQGQNCSSKGYLEACFRLFGVHWQLFVVTFFSKAGHSRTWGWHAPKHLLRCDIRSKVRIIYFIHFGMRFWDEISLHEWGAVKCNQWFEITISHDFFFFLSSLETKVGDQAWAIKRSAKWVFFIVLSSSHLYHHEEESCVNQTINRIIYWWFPIQSVSRVNVSPRFDLKLTEPVTGLESIS